MCPYFRSGKAFSPNKDEYQEFELGCLMTSKITPLFICHAGAKPHLRQP
jgi:hypothetical protein